LLIDLRNLNLMFKYRRRKLSRRELIKGKWKMK